jgi:hypothetical protein
MMIATAINIDPCESFMGNYINILSLKNKEDYARMHGYGFYYALDQQNSTLFGPWNKIKVGKGGNGKKPPTFYILTELLTRGHQRAHGQWCIVCTP